MNNEVIGALGAGAIVGGLITYTSYKNAIVKDLEGLKATTEENNKLKEEFKILEELIEEVQNEKEALEKEVVKKSDYENLLTEANKVITEANNDQLQIKEAIEGILNTVEATPATEEAPVVEEVPATEEATVEVTVEEVEEAVENSIEINEDTLKLTIEEIEEATTEETEKDK